MSSRRQTAVWPILVIAAGAAVSIWAGWVGLGQLTGFGVVQLLPGIWNDLRINTSITLPIGMEAYAAYGLYVWLASDAPRRAKEFARVSALGALTLGALGQIAYHLMAAAGVRAAPWPVTAAVSCLPVGVLGMAAALAHLVRSEEDTRDEAQTETGGRVPTADPAVPAVGQPFRTVAPAPAGPAAPSTAPVFRAVPNWSAVSADRPEHTSGTAHAGCPGSPSRDATSGRPEHTSRTEPAGSPAEASRDVPVSRLAPVEQDVSATPVRTSRKTSGGTSRAGGSGRRRGRPVKAASDAELVDQVRALSEATGGPPSAHRIKTALGVGHERATRLLAEVTATTGPSGPAHANGVGATPRREGAE